MHLLPEDPLVLLDSADLIADPERALRAFCERLAIPYDPAMLTWENTRVPCFDKWKGFVSVFHPYPFYTFMRNPDFSRHIVV